MASPDLHKLLDKFLENPSVLPADIKFLSDYLADEPETASMENQLPAEEIKERLEIATTLMKEEDSDDELFMSTFDLSTIMAIPLEQLRNMKAEEARHALHSIRDFVQLCRWRLSPPWGSCLLTRAT